VIDPSGLACLLDLGEDTLLQSLLDACTKLVNDLAALGSVNRFDHLRAEYLGLPDGVSVLEVGVRIPPDEELRLPAVGVKSTLSRGARLSSDISNSV
jgi:hypothetical protein